MAKRATPREDQPSPTTTIPTEQVGPGAPLTADQIQKAIEATQQSATGYPSNFSPPPRKYTIGGVTKTYSGNQLVNLNTGALMPQYDLNNDPAVVIADIAGKQGPNGLNKFLSQLKSRGFYGGANVGNGYTGADVNAVQTFLFYANGVGLERESALASAITNLPQYFPSRSGGSYQLTNPTDLSAVFQATAQQVIGRGLSQADIDKLIASYQQLEKTAGLAASRSGGYTAPPSAQTYASEQVREMFSGEAQDFRAMDVADSLLGIMKGA